MDSKIELEKLELKDGDILLAKYPYDMSPADRSAFAHSLINSPEWQNRKDAQCIFIEKDADIKALPEEEMNKAGWFRMSYVTPTKELPAEDIKRFIAECEKNHAVMLDEMEVETCQTTNPIEHFNIESIDQKHNGNMSITLIPKDERQKEVLRVITRDVHQGVIVIPTLSKINSKDKADEGAREQHLGYKPLVRNYHYNYNLDLERGVNLNLHIFSPEEQRWIFSYEQLEYDEREGRKKTLVFRNKYKVVANYQKGLLSDTLDITMDMVWPERRGKVFTWGLDISPNSKLFVEFKYKRMPEGHFRLKTIIAGAGKRFDVEGDESGNALLKKVELPVPINDIIECDLNKCFNVPFVNDGGNLDNFIIMESLDVQIDEM